MTIAQTIATDSLTWEIHDNHGQAAELIVSTATREILHIWTREDRRGEGLARCLYETATAQTTVLHAPVGHRTPEGDFFAAAMGGETAEYPCNCYACTWTEEED